jgi:hypothetical protein
VLSPASNLTSWLSLRKYIWFQVSWAGANIYMAKQKNSNASSQTKHQKQLRHNRTNKLANTTTPKPKQDSCIFVCLFVSLFVCLVAGVVEQLFLWFGWLVGGQIGCSRPLCGRVVSAFFAHLFVQMFELFDCYLSLLLACAT